jgi:hypothetical protein
MVMVLAMFDLASDFASRERNAVYVYIGSFGTDRCDQLIELSGANSLIGRTDYICCSPVFVLLTGLNCLVRAHGYKRGLVESFPG